MNKNIPPYWGHHHISDHERLALAAHLPHMVHRAPAIQRGRSCHPPCQTRKSRDALGKPKVKPDAWLKEQLPA